MGRETKMIKKRKEKVKKEKQAVAILNILCK